MVLQYKFKYTSNNNSLITILDNILAKKETTYNLYKEGDFLFLYVDDDEEKLLKISDELSTELPMSIFLEDYTLEVVPQFPIVNYQYTPDSRRKSYCSNCLTKVENNESKFFYYPFLNCEICGTTCDVEKIEISSKDEEFTYSNYKEFFEKLALAISSNKKVKINNYVFTKFEKLEKDDEKILCTNLDKLPNIVVSSKQKIALLLSLEKPTICFNVNAIYKTNNNCLVNKVDVKAPWNIFYHLLAKELLSLNIDFVKFEADEDFDLEISFNDIENNTKISVTQSKIHFLENSFYDKALDELYNKFDEKSKSQFMVLLSENELFEKSIINIYASSKYDMAISLYSPKIDGVVDLVSFKIPKSVDEIFEGIKKEENGERLLENFKNEFEKEYESALNTDISFIKDCSLNSLLKIPGTILGIDNIYKEASSALLQKGPRLDFKIINKEKLFNKEFDFIKLVKSGISFKLAGVDEKTLALGYVESFIYFLSDLIDDVNENFPIDGISLSGDLIADEFFNKILKLALTTNFKLYYNKDFPIQL